MELDPLNQTSDSERAMNMAEVKREAEIMLDYSDAEEGEIMLLQHGHPVGAGQLELGVGHPVAGTPIGAGEGAQIGAGSCQLDIGVEHPGAGGLRGGGPPRAGVIQPRVGYPGAEIPGAKQIGSGAGYTGVGSGYGFPGTGASLYVAGEVPLGVTNGQQGAGTGPPSIRAGARAMQPIEGAEPGYRYMVVGAGRPMEGDGRRGAGVGHHGTGAAWLGAPGARSWRGQQGGRPWHRPRGQGWSRGQVRCRPHRRRACRACNAPLHIRVNTILSEIADKIEELDGRRPTISQIRNMINNTSF